MSLGLVLPLHGGCQLTNAYKVGQLGWAFVGEVASQRLRARTAGLAAAMSVVFGLTFNTAVPVMRKSSYPYFFGAVKPDVGQKKSKLYC